MLSSASHRRVRCCGETQPGPTELFTPSFNGASGCFTPKFNVVLVATGPSTFEGPVTGDLEGAIEFVFEGGFKLTGGTAANQGLANWDITGGIVPGLGMFQTSFENRNQLVQPPDFLFENKGKHRALDGVEKANVTTMARSTDRRPQRITIT